jgi:uncharacterized membrane protein
MTNNNTRKIVLTSMLISLVFVASFFNVPSPAALGGLVHLGTLVSLVIAMRFGKYYGAIAAGVGMGLFDIFGGWFIWFPVTLIARLIMGYIVGLISSYSHKGQGKNVYLNLISWAAGLLIMLSLYYLYEAIVISDFNIALKSVPGNLAQFLIGLIAPFSAVYLFKEIPVKEYNESSNRAYKI